MGTNSYIFCIHFHFSCIFGIVIRAIFWKFVIIVVSICESFTRLILMLIWLVEGVVCSSYFWRFHHCDVLHATHMVSPSLWSHFFFITILVGEVHHDYSHFLVVPLSKHNIISFFPSIQWFASRFDPSIFLNTIYIAITMIVIFPLLVTRVPSPFFYFKVLIALLPIILVILAHL